MITDGSPTGFTGGVGFNGIVAALFGQLHPILAIPASILFGALLVGANTMQRVVQIPSALIMALNGLVVVFVVSSEVWRKKRQYKRLSTCDDESPSGPQNNEHPEKPMEKTT